ncbi:MAG: GtrA family protein [Eubacteriales bacterium]|nr:GtrA family protein [Eubacteriales bacterium]MDD3503114.1 GtrA family protein [Eubacteriales bacterium]MDD4683142.1 GtrA family protein [Eubacteriales bacterium]
MLKRLSFLFNREIIVYIIAGVLTTMVNLVVFTLLTRIFGSDQWWISNFPAIVAAILFAFWANRTFVFRSNGPFWPELGKFVAARVFTALAFEYGAMFLLTDVLQMKAVLRFGPWELLISKLLTQFLVLAGNYVFSKLFVFRSAK